MPDAPHRVPNRLWAGALVDELVRCGVGLFCLAPGSRSTPLALAVAQAVAAGTAEHVVHFDERGAAFCALGWARATGRPAALVTTSGTAVANALPAVAEASVDAVPLLLLTADRPPELRETGANQTIRQPGIFGEHVRWHFDLPTPTPDIALAFVRTTAAQAVHRALGRPAGPVHLNCPFREPLEAEPLADREAGPPNAPANGRARAEPTTRYTAAAALDPAALAGLAERLRGTERGLVVAGRLRTRAEGEAAVRLAEALGWPLLPDVGSQVRLGPAGEAACPFYDQLLGSEVFRTAHAPEAVLYLGGRSTSKRLGQLLAASRPSPFVVVRDDPFRFDPDHRVTDRIEADVAGFCAALVGLLERPGKKSDWLAAWRRASDAAAETLDAYFAERDALTEPAAARLAAQHAGGGLVLAASMPVRDADAFGSAALGAAPLVASNRGASGLDGPVATAAGFARGLGAPVTLLVGDLALLHDLNSLALLRHGQPVTVVAVNNDGGGIFHFLPIADPEVAERADVFEPYFGTPHGLGFEHAARLFGLPYHRPETCAGFEDALAQTDGPALIEVRTERVANRALHDDLLARVAAAVAATSGAAAMPSAEASR